MSQQLSNPRRAFGYTTQQANQGNVQTQTYHNVSTVHAIRRGMAVALSTLSADGKGVTPSTIAGDNRVVGIALGNAAVGSSVRRLSSNAVGGAWVNVAVSGGPLFALVSTAAVNGSRLWNSNSTHTGIGGGILGPVTLSTGAGAVQKVVAIAHTSGSTVSTAGTTQPPTALITLDPAMLTQSALTTNF